MQSNQFERLQAALSRVGFGDKSSDHKAEIAGWSGWNYVAISSVCRQVLRSQAYVYDDSKIDNAKDIRKKYRTEFGGVWRKAFNREHDGALVDSNHNLLRLLNTPNPGQSGPSFRSEQVQQLRLHGACVVWNRPNEAGTRTVERYVCPLALVTPIAPTRKYKQGAIRIDPAGYMDQFAEVVDDDGWIEGNSPIFRALGRSTDWTIPAEMLSIVRYHNPVYRTDGTSPTTAISKWIDTLAHIDIQRMEWHSEGPNGKIVITVSADIDPEKLKTYERELNDKFGADGPNVVLMRYGSQVASQRTAEEAGFEQSWEQLKSALLATHGVSRAMLGDMDSMTYGALEAAMFAGTMLSIQPDLDQIADEDTRDLAPQYEGELLVEYEIDPIESPETRDNRLNGAADRGAVSLGEYRTSMGFPLFGDERDDMMMTRQGPMPLEQFKQNGAAAGGGMGGPPPMGGIGGGPPEPDYQDQYGHEPQPWQFSYSSPIRKSAKSGNCKTIEKSVESMNRLDFPVIGIDHDVVAPNKRVRRGMADAVSILKKAGYRVSMQTACAEDEAKSYATSCGIDAINKEHVEATWDAISDGAIDENRFDMTELLGLVKRLPDCAEKQLLCSLLGVKERNEFGVVMLPLDNASSATVMDYARDSIDESDVVAWEDSPHVTLLYGIVGDDVAEPVRLVRRLPVPTCTIGKVEVFPSDKGSALVLRVESPQLEEANAMLRRSLPYREFHAEYKPHITLCYLRPGAEAQYLGPTALEGMTVNFDAATVRIGESTVAVPLRSQAPVMAGGGDGNVLVAPEFATYDRLKQFTGNGNGHVKKKPKNKKPVFAQQGEKVTVAGLAVIAKDTGRLLMLQRALSDSDPAAGCWEFPGGHLEDGEREIEAAKREWSEETGHIVPKGKEVGSWHVGIYRGFVWEIASEDKIKLNLDHEDRKVLNPDDPDGDCIETVAWFSPGQLVDNSSLRPELRRDIGKVLEAIGKANVKVTSIEKSTATLPRDADGDGLIFDGTPREQRAPSVAKSRLDRILQKADSLEWTDDLVSMRSVTTVQELRDNSHPMDLQGFNPETDDPQQWFVNNVQRKGAWGKDEYGNDCLAFVVRGRTFEITVSDDGNGSYDAIFYDDNMSTDKTGKGDAHVVFANVLTAMASFVKKRKPWLLSFTGDGDSRTSLYERMVRSISGVSDRYVAYSGKKMSDRAMYAIVDRDHDNAAAVEAMFKASGYGRGSEKLIKANSKWEVSKLPSATRAEIASWLLPEPESDEWIGVDLDGTLANYDEFRGVDHIGEPIDEMVDRVKQWLADGKNVKIFTARVADPSEADAAREAIEDWCEEHIGQKLDVTNVKDRHMTELWDDRAVSVEKNTGQKLSKSFTRDGDGDGLVFDGTPQEQRVSFEYSNHLNRDGLPRPEAPEWVRNRYRKTALSKQIAEVEREIELAEKNIDDWSSRKYKDNSTVLGSKTEEGEYVGRKTIGDHNESRRRKAVNSLKDRLESNRKLLDSLKAQLSAVGDDKAPTKAPIEIQNDDDFLNFLLGKSLKNAVEQITTEPDDSAKAKASEIADILIGIFGDSAESKFDSVYGTIQKLFRASEWREIDHPRGKNGRFIVKNSPEAVAAAKARIRQVLSSSQTAEGLQQLVENLSILTVEQLRDLKREFGIRASGPNKDSLVAKIASRLHRGRSTESKPEPVVKPKKEKTAEEFLVGKHADKIRVLGSYLHKRIADGEAVSLLGQAVKSPQDLASVAQVYRDPRYETVRAIFVDKDGTVIGQNAYSSKMPSVAMVPKTFKDDVKRDMVDLDADKFYLLHNHPSGDPNPSRHDIVFTEQLKKEFGDKLAEHVIINHNKFATISTRHLLTMEGVTHDVEFGEVKNENLWCSPEMPHELLGSKVGSTDEFAQMATKLGSASDRPVMIFTDAKLKVISLIDVSKETLKSNTTALFAALRRMNRKVGAGGMRFMVLPEGVKDDFDAPSLIKKGLLTDFIAAGEDSSYRQNFLVNQDIDRSGDIKHQPVAPSFREQVKRSLISELRKSFREDQHPRGKNGRFIDGQAIAAAGKDPSKIQALMQQVDPKDVGKLQSALKAAGASDQSIASAQQPAQKQPDQQQIPRTQNLANGQRSNKGIADQEIEKQRQIEQQQKSQPVDIESELAAGDEDKSPNISYDAWKSKADEFERVTGQDITNFADEFPFGNYKVQADWMEAKMNQHIDNQQFAWDVEDDLHPSEFTPSGNAVEDQKTLDWARARRGVRNQFRRDLAKSDLPDDKKQTYLGHMNNALARMPRAAIDSVQTNLHATQWHAGTSALTWALQSAGIADLEQNENANYQGAYVHGSKSMKGGTLHLDGGRDPMGTYHHEMAHVCDWNDSVGYLSRTPEWNAAWNSEIADKSISDYGATSASEGWAEFARYAWSGVTKDEVVASHPKAAAVFEKYGLI